MKKTSSPTSVTSTPIKGPIETSAKPFGGIVHSRRATASFNRFVTSPWLDLRQDRCASLPSHLQRSQHLGGNLMEIKFDFDTPISPGACAPSTMLPLYRFLLGTLSDPAQQIRCPCRNFPMKFVAFPNHLVLDQSPANSKQQTRRRWHL